MLSKDLTRQYRIIQDMAAAVTKSDVPDSGQFIKNIYHPDFDIADLEHILQAYKDSTPGIDNPLDLFYQLSKYIKVKTGKVSQATLDIYRNMGEHLRDYQAFRQKPVIFKCLNYDFYDRYTHYLMYEYVQKQGIIKKYQRFFWRYRSR